MARRDDLRSEEAGAADVEFGAALANRSMTYKERQLIDLIRGLAEFLLPERLTVEDVVRRVGRVADDPGIPMPIELEPMLPGVLAAQLARYPESGLPYVLRISPEPAASPTAGALRAALGTYKRVLTTGEAPSAVAFPPLGDARGWRVVIYATVDTTAGDPDSARATSFSLRRDPPLA